MALTPATNKQVPDHSIMDAFYKQTYLGNAYIVPFSITLANTNETPFVLVSNPALSGTAFPNGKGIFINLRRFTSSDQQALIKTYSNPTISTTGTASVPSNLRLASSNTSIAQCYPNGQFTVSANGTAISAIGCAASDYVVMDNLLLVIVDPGQSVLITAKALSANTSLNADVSWYEI